MSDKTVTDYMTVGGKRLNKPNFAACAILGKVGNRFYLGFTEADQEAIGGEITVATMLRFQEDIFHWYLVCTAEREQIKEWFNSPPEVFREAVFEYMAESDADTKFLADLLTAIITMQKEMQENAPQVVPDKTPKGKHTPRKKKATLRRT